MAQFSFRLQSILDLRLAARDHCRAELAKAFEADQRLADQLKSIRAEMARLRETACVASAPGEISVDHLLNTNRYELLLGAQCGQISQQRQLIQQEIERRQQALLQADRQVKAMERLKETRRGEFLSDAARREGKQLDELGMIQVARRSEASS